MWNRVKRAGTADPSPGKSEIGWKGKKNCDHHGMEHYAGSCSDMMSGFSLYHSCDIG